MKRKLLFALLLTGFLVIFSRCRQSGSAARSSLVISEIESPAGAGSSAPNFFTDENEQLYLSWIEKSGEKQTSLKYADMQAHEWSKARTIAEGKRWFVNWADFPSLVALNNNRLAAHWLAKSGEGAYAYNVNIAQSADGGKTWSRPIVPHNDGTETEHGFVSMLPWLKDRLFVVWLDGRNFAQQTHSNGHGSPKANMTLRFATLDAQGQVYDETVLDSRTCECCQTSAARTKDGAIVAYRDRSENEIRDISIVVWNDGKWSEPRTLYPDNWEIHGCPVNGPAVSANQENVAIAWFTAAQNKPKILVAFSEDSGQTFGQPVQLNEGETVGRVDVILLQDGSALVSWMASTAQGGEIQVCRVQPQGAKDLMTTLAKINTGRASGFPQMARSGDKIFFAWTQVGHPTTIRTAVAEITL
ncbi:MAG: sialidase family protein [bacterium]